MDMLTFSKTSPALAALLIIGCGMPATPTEVKMAGVGLNPDEIGASPTYHGGLIEYNLIDFAGAQLPLGLVGLVSYDQVGPEVNFRPPYKMVMGSGFLFQDDSLAPDVTMGTLTKPPASIGVCQTRFEPRSYLSGLVDAGNAITFKTESGKGGWTVGRRPFVYPPDVRDVNAYYMELDAWKPEPSFRKVRLNPESANPMAMAEQVHLPANFPEGMLVEVDFPGGSPPLEANMGSIPVPLAAAGGNRSIILPHSPQGVRLAWNGPRYNRYGLMVDATHPEATEYDATDTGGAPDVEQSTCLQYLPHANMPANASDCMDLADTPRTPAEFGALGLDYATRELNGQMYTGPWDTSDQELTIEWMPGEPSAGEFLTLTVRFLGPVDRTNVNMVEATVAASGVAPGAEAAWAEAVASGKVPDQMPLPESDRLAMSCDNDLTGNVESAGKRIEWPLVSSYTNEDDSFVPSLHGDPGHNLAEVTCRLDDQAGRFVLTQDILDTAMDYAAMHGAEGAVFFVSRSTEAEIQAPPVRDRYGKRHDNSPVKVVSRSIQVGRFWYGQ
jgi:hypothetical protein